MFNYIEWKSFGRDFLCIFGSPLIKKQMFISLFYSYTHGKAGYLKVFNKCFCQKFSHFFRSEQIMQPPPPPPVCLLLYRFWIILFISILIILIFGSYFFLVWHYQSLVTTMRVFGIARMIIELSALSIGPRNGWNSKEHFKLEPIVPCHLFRKFPRDLFTLIDLWVKTYKI